jgi:protease-4
VDALAQGQVWTGREAKQNGLIDELGGIRQALDYTARRAGVDDYRVAVYPVKRPLFLLPGRSLFRMLAGLLMGESNVVDDGINLLPDLCEEGIYARMPYDLHIE